MRKILLLAYSILLVHLAGYSQADSTEKKKIKFRTGLQFISNQTYAGRTDSLKLPVLVPSLSFTTPAGFYTKLKGYVNLSSGNSGFDGISIEPGYEISKEHWDVSFSLIKNFISDSSNLIIAPIKTSLEFYAGNRNKIINPYAGAEYLFSPDGNDLIVYGGLSKSLLLSRKDKEPSINFEPSFGLTGGTQTFFYSYLKKYAINGKSSSTGRGRGRPTMPAIVTSPTLQQTVEVQSRSFSLLAAEAEFPLTISNDKMEFIIDPCWVSPINLVNKGGAGTERAKAYLYLNAELAFNF